MLEIVKEILGYAAEHSIMAVLITSILLFFCWFIWKMFKELVKSKDKEIERLVKERNFLQELLLSDRLSSADKEEEE